MPSRGSTTGRGYGTDHQRLRSAWTPTVATGTVRCARCHKRITPDQAWDLGHAHGTRHEYAGPEHATCNRSRRPPTEPHPGALH